MLKKGCKNFKEILKNIVKIRKRFQKNNSE